MSRRSKRNQQSPASLFAFQDIITAVTGIMLLIILIAALSLITRTMDAATQQVTLSPAEQLEQQIQDQIEANDAASKRLAETSALLAKLAAGAGITEGGLEALQKKTQETQQNNERLSQAQADARAELEKLKPKVAERREQLKRLAAQLQELRNRQDSDTTQVTLQGGRENGKRPLLVEMGADRWTIAHVQKDKSAKILTTVQGADRLRQFARWVDTRDANDEYFVLLVRPQATGLFLPARKVLAKAGFDVGWDIWPDRKRLSRR